VGDYWRHERLMADVNFDVSPIFTGYSRERRRNYHDTFGFTQHVGYQF
jgi:hypothetical protein